MGKTSKSAWKKRESDAAKLFGCRRAVLSGSGNRPDRSRSDSTSETVFLEVKLRAHHAAVTLYDETRKLARLEGKIPVVALATKYRAGILLLIAPEDLALVAAELADLPCDTPTPPTPPQLGHSFEGN